MVLTTRQLGKRVHLVLYDARGRIVVLVDRFAALEVDIRILGCTADRGVIWGESALAMLNHEVIADHFANGIAADLFDLLDFVRATEAVKEMQERHT